MHGDEILLPVAIPHLHSLGPNSVLEMTLLAPTDQGLLEMNDLPAVLTLNHYQTNTHLRGSIFIY